MEIFDSRRKRSFSRDTPHSSFILIEHDQKEDTRVQIIIELLFATKIL